MCRLHRACSCPARDLHSVQMIVGLFSPALCTPFLLPQARYKELNGVGLSGCFRIRALGTRNTHLNPWSEFQTVGILQNMATWEMPPFK